MEELLLDIMKEANGTKGTQLRKTCQQAYDLLCTQQGNTRDPSYELRRVCFLPLQIALETKKPKLVSLALNGFHKILRDDRFHRGNEPEDDSLWLPSQLLCATSSMMYHPQETQVHILRVLLALGLRNGGALNGRLVLWLAGRCAEAAVSPPVAAPARAAAAMTIRAFCLSLDEECQELLNEGSPLVNNKAAAVACFSEIIPVMQYLCSRLCETQTSTKTNNVTAIFYLECLLTLVTSLPEVINSNTHFTNFLWQKFCPALISFLGTPKVDKNIKSRDEGQGVDDSGRGSGSLASAPSFNSQQAKSVYSIAGQLLRLVGCVGTMRPVLEALYHRMLLYPPISHRAEALASTKDILGDPKKLCYLLILRQSNNIMDQHSDDMALVRLIMDAIEECAASNNSNVLLVSLECVVNLLGALEELCDGKYLPPNATEINNKWPNLEEADYRGPLTYQSLARLPSPYRDLVAEMQNKLEHEGTDSSDTSGPEDNGSGSDAELDSDADSVFLPSRQHAKYRRDSIDNLSPTRDTPEVTQFMKSVPSTLNLGRCNITEYNVDVERQNAKQFVKTLQNVMVPKLLALRTCVEVDEAMQDFASKCCQFNAARSPSTSTIMNADGIYLATFSTLLLNLKLICAGYYKGSSASVPLSEDEFVEEVHGSGVLVYLSATWLCEVYQQVLSISILEIGGYQPQLQENNALINLLIDYGGLCSSQVMCDWQRLKEVSSPNSNITSAEKTASLKLARRVLTCMWDSMVTLLSTPLVGRYSGNNNLSPTAKLKKLLPRKSKFLLKKDKARDELISLSLEGLHKAARISNVLGLQNRCSSLLALLSDSACSEPPSIKIVSAHALSLDVLISGGLELGSHSVDCWKHIFMACQYVSRLEHTLFGQQCNTTTPLITLQTSHNKTVSFTQNSQGSFLSDKLQQSFNFNQGQEDETCVDIYNFLQSSMDNVSSSNKMTVASIIQKLGKENTKTNNTPGFICGTDAAKVCCALSQQVDSLFNDAASKLNLPALCGFLQQLCLASEKQLCTESLNSEQNVGRWWKGVLGREGGKNTGSYWGGGGGGLLARAGDVTLQCLRAPRPLSHHMAVWTIVGPHFMKAACSKDRRISKKAIQCLHDAITLLLNEQTELPHFHFNEALLKPFENLLCLELCDNDVQEQIISCLCQFVEANQTEIKSGWRPLFGTLRAAHNNNHFAAVLEIFRVFLNTDNTLVFANAAVDCILCLLSYVKDSTLETVPSKYIISPQKSPESNSKTIFNFSHKSYSNSDKSDTENTNVEYYSQIEICRESLEHIKSCADILGLMYSMPKCPTFNIAHRFNVDAPLQVVDALFPKTALHVKHFSNSSDIHDSNIISYGILSTALPISKSSISLLTKLDRPSGILKVWHLMIEGLVSACISCPKPYQITAFETLFKILQDMMSVPGPLFGLHCINHLLLPSMQNWLRQVNVVGTEWEKFTPNFKHCCGMATDLVVKYLNHLQHDNECANDIKRNDQQEYSDSSDNDSDYHGETMEIKAVTFALKELLLILVECVSQPHEIVARLGASCIRHVILTSGYLLTPKQWEITCTSLHRACNASLAPLQQLTLAFDENSNSFYGDLAIVKVAARCDSSINDNVRLHSMAQQVFLYDYSKEHTLSMRPPQNYTRQQSQSQLIKNLVLTDDRSYIFLLYPQDATSSPNPDGLTIRIPHKSLVIGLLAHQILVQIIATILLQNISNIMPLNHILLETFKSSGMALNSKYSIGYNNIEILLKCLDMSYKRAISFDLRPGLKFLVQKVSNLDCAANLYKHTTASWIIKMIALTELHLQGFSKNRVTFEHLQDMESGLDNMNTNNKYMKRSLDLKHSWDLICDLYIDAIEIDCVAADLACSEKSGSCNEITNDPGDNEEERSDAEVLNNSEKISLNSKAGSCESLTPNEESIEKFTPKPFTFSDFKNQSDEANCESDDEKKDALLNSESLHSEIVDDVQEDHTSLESEDTKPKGVLKIDLKFTNSGQSGVRNIPTPTANKQQPIEPLLPAQPVPPEIEQERIHSISKDSEAKRISLANILAAYLELVLSFPRNQFEMTAPLLEQGYLKLAKCATDPLLLQRIEAFSNKRDTV